MEVATTGWWLAEVCGLSGGLGWEAGECAFHRQQPGHLSSLSWLFSLPRNEGWALVKMEVLETPHSPLS